MPKVDTRDLDFIDDDYVGYEKIRKTPKKEIKADEKPKSNQNKLDVSEK
tara:strand:+ start:23872 stop:24018 length:147 start_codon:yes stop_codon:yes gene_type:complete